MDDLFKAIEENNAGWLRALLVERVKRQDPALERLDDLRNRAGQSLVTAAAAAGHSHLLRILQDHGANFSAPDDTGRTVAHCAAARGDDRMMQFLRAVGGDLERPDANGWAPLHVATLCNHGEVVRELCAAGVDPLVLGRHGESSATLAASRGHDRVLQALWDSFPERSALPADSGPHIPSAGLDGTAAVDLPTGALGLLTKQPRSGCEVLEAVDHQGNSPAHHAAYQGRAPTVGLLHRLGSSIHGQNARGDTPSHFAVLRGQVEVLECLNDLGADFTTPNHAGVTPFQLAVLSHQMFALVSLVEAGIPGPTSVQHWPGNLAPRRTLRMQGTVDLTLLSVAAGEFSSGTPRHRELAHMLAAPVVRPNDPVGTAVRRAVRDVYAGDWRGRLDERLAHALDTALEAQRVAAARCALLREVVGAAEPGEVSDLTPPLSPRSDAVQPTDATRPWEIVSRRASLPAAGGNAPGLSRPCGGCATM